MDFLRELGSQKTNSSGGSTVITTTAAAPSGSAILVVLESHDDLGAAPTCADSAGNSYTLIGSRRPSSDTAKLWVFAKMEAATLGSGGAITISHGGSSAVRLAHAHCATGITVLDKKSLTTGLGNALKSGFTDTTENAQEYLWGIAAWNEDFFGLTDFAANDSWTAMTKVAKDQDRLRCFHKVVNAQNRYQFAGQLSLFVAWSAAIFTFKVAAQDRDIFIQDAGYGSDDFRAAVGDRSITISETGTFSDGPTQPAGAPYAATITDEGTGADRVTVRDAAVTQELRLGNQVPSGGVNLAWLQMPILLPNENLSLVDAAGFIAENDDLAWKEALPSGAGFLSADGWLHRTIYNPEPTSGTIATGAAQYVATRPPDTLADPPQWNVQQFTSQIKVLHPGTGEKGIGWYPKVQDGLVVRRHILQSDDQTWLAQVFSPGDELVLYYTIVEAQNIPYDGDDHTLAVTQTAVDLDGKSFTLPDTYLWEVTSIQVNDQELLASGEVLDRDGSLPAAVASWDPEAGSITLKRTLGENDTVRCTYRYQEFLYTFRGHYDEEVGAYRDLDLNPEPGHTYDGGRATSELLSRPVYLYLIPSAAYRRSRLNDDGTRTYEPDRTIYSGMRFTESFLRWQLGGSPVGRSVRVDVPVEETPEEETPPPDPGDGGQLDFSVATNSSLFFFYFE